MAPDGDITDAFDDADDLIRSVEQGQQGPWNDETAKFTDPDIENLAAELQGTRQHDYSERRLRELRDRARRKDRPEPKKQKTPVTPAVPAAPWGDNLFEDASEPEVTTSGTPAKERFTAAEEHSFESIPETVVAPTPTTATPAAPNESALVRYAPSVFAAMLVFVAATVIHGLLLGWQPHLLVRALGAMAVTGWLWQALQSGRLRATVIGTLVYTAAFVPATDMRAPEHIFAVVLGLLVVVAGAGLIGVQRREI